jgi:nitrile hydratase
MTNQIPGVVTADGEVPLFRAGDRVVIDSRFPVGHYRVPRYIRGRPCMVEAVMKPPAVNNEEEGFGRNAGAKRHYYRVAIALKDVWPDYRGSPADGLRIEIYESWLKRI